MAGRWHYPPQWEPRNQENRPDFGCLIAVAVFVATWVVIIFGIVRCSTG